MCRALDADIENNREFAKEMGKRHDTGDKGPNTHRAHAEHIVITDNK